MQWSNGAVLAGVFSESVRSFVTPRCTAQRKPPRDDTEAVEAAGAFPNSNAFAETAADAKGAGQKKPPGPEPERLR